MKRTREKLSALAVERASRKPGLYGDGAGLYLLVSTQGKRSSACSWVFRYMLRRKAHSMGLGPYPEITLAHARERSLAARRLLVDGIDPLEARKAKGAQAKVDAAKAMTFKTAAEKYIAAHKAEWKNEKHAAQWGSTLATYAYPTIGGLPAVAIDTPLVMKVLEPIWSVKPETASRLRGRIEAVLNWAKVSGYRDRDGENPARWHGHLDNLLAARAKVQKVKHHAALPFDGLPNFMTALRAQEGIAARALEFAILTAMRTGEVIGATWGEINLADKIWIIPGDRMKAGREHRVPLSAGAVAILEAMLKIAENGDPGTHVFPGRKRGKPLSNMAMLVLLRRMGRGDLTAHGFRSTFRDWVSEHTNVPREVAEMALAHTIGDKVEAAYRRGDLFERRRALMDQWASVCTSRVPESDIRPGGRSGVSRPL